MIQRYSANRNQRIIKRRQLKIHFEEIFQNVNKFDVKRGDQDLPNESTIVIAE